MSGKELAIVELSDDAVVTPCELSKMSNKELLQKIKDCLAEVKNRQDMSDDELLSEEELACVKKKAKMEATCPKCGKPVSQCTCEKPKDEKMSNASGIVPEGKMEEIMADETKPQAEPVKVELAKVEPVPVEAPKVEELAKVTTEVTKVETPAPVQVDLSKEIVELTKTVEELSKKLAILESQPIKRAVETLSEKKGREYHVGKDGSISSSD